MKVTQVNQFYISALVLPLLLSGCPMTPVSPDRSVVVPASDSTLPTAVGVDVFDPDAISFDAASQPMTIIAVSDVVTVIAGARDDDGGIKAVKMWATYTYYRQGQTVGPGLVSVPVAQNASNAVVGESTLKSRIVSSNFDLKKRVTGLVKYQA